MDEKILKEIYQEHRKLGCVIITWDEWEEKVKKAYYVLVIRAKEIDRDNIPITYSELGTKIELNPISEWFQLKIGWICGACSEYEYYAGRPLISALVISKETNKPGMGFWALPGIPPNLRRDCRIGDSTPFPIDRNKERDEFWLEELKKIDSVWKSNLVNG